MILLLSFIICMGAGTVAHGFEDEVRWIPGTTNINCRYNRVMPSTDGESVAISQMSDTFQAERDFKGINQIITISNIPNSIKEGEDLQPIAHVLGTTNSRIQPLFWSDQGLMLRVGSDGLAIGTLGSDWDFETVSFDKAWRSFEITINSPQGLLALNDPGAVLAAASLSRRANLRRRSAFLSSTITYSAIDLADSQHLLVGSDPSNLSSIGPGAFFHRFNVLNDSEGAQVTYLGFENEAGLRSSGREYSLPIVDVGSGRQVGIFRPDQVELDGGFSVVNQILESGGYLIKDAAFSDGRLFVLAENGMDHTVFVFRDHQDTAPERLHVCSDETSLRALAAPKSEGPRRRPTIGIRLTEQSDTTGILYESEAQVNRGVILYFHGGPAVASDPHIIPWPVRELWLAGYDILAVEYSGSVGGGLSLSSGLQSKSMFGFEEDAKAVRDWLRTMDYPEVHSYAVSYGAIPAMVIVSSYPDMFKSKIFVAPLLRHPSLSVLETSERFSQVERGAQFEFERGLYGTERRRLEYISFIEILAGNYQASLDDLFVFGTHDRLTPLEAAPQSILSNAKILQVERSHAFVTADENALLEIYRHVVRARPHHEEAASPPCNEEMTCRCRLPETDRF